MNATSRGAVAVFRPWSRSEEARLRELYGKARPVEIAKAIGRTESAVFRRAQRLGLVTHRRWTPKEDRLLTELWGQSSAGAIARRLDRKRTAIYWRAYKLGLLIESYRGLEFFTTAAERTGYDRGSLRLVLRWAGVEMRRRTTRPGTRSHRFLMVDPVDVDEAIERWHRTEAVYPAAKDRGIGGETLRRILKQYGAAGFKVPEEPKREKAHWRVDTAVIDRAIAWRKERESLSAAARRTGISRFDLGPALAKAGIPRQVLKPWLVPKSAVDRVAAELERSAA